MDISIEKYDELIKKATILDLISLIDDDDQIADMVRTYRTEMTECYRSFEQPIIEKPKEQGQPWLDFEREGVGEP